MRINRILAACLIVLCSGNLSAQSKDTHCDVKYEFDHTFYYPNNLICRLYIERRSIKTVWLWRKSAASTGFFIRPNVILTNGHNVASNMWSSVESIRVYPGYNKGKSAQDHYSVEGRKNSRKVVVIPKQYGLAKREKKRYPYDYALIYLGDYRSPNGDSLELDEIDPQTDTTVFTLGYPAAIFSDSSNHSTRTNGVNTIGEVQYFTSGNIKKDRFTDRQIFFFTCTKGGNSGSPVMVMRDEDQVKVVGIHNAAHTGVRVTKEVIDTIDYWVELFEKGEVPKHDHFE